MRARDRTGPEAAHGAGAAMSVITACLGDAVAIRGAVDASLVDYTTGRLLGALDSAGAAASRPDAAALVDAALQAIAYAPGATSGSIEDIILTTADLHHLIRPVRTGPDPRLMLYLRLDRTEGSLALARWRLRTLADDLGWS